MRISYLSGRPSVVFRVGHMRRALFILMELLVASSVILSSANAIAADPKPSLIVHPAPEGLAANPDYAVRVRQGQGEWKNVFINSVLVVKEFRGNEKGHDDHVVSNASVATFDFLGTVEVEISVAYTQPTAFTIRPLARNVIGQLDGSAIRFQLDKPSKLVIAVNGDKTRELHFFAGTPETDIPTEKTPGVKYFGPGVHTLDPFEYKLKSNETVYLAGGAVVHGQFTCQGIKSATIRGRGMIDQSDRFTPGGRRGSTGVSILNSHNVVVDGITVLDAEGYQFGIGGSDHVTIKNANGFSVAQWGDGIDAMSTSHLTIQNVFIRSSDDSIALYCGRWTYAGDSRDITVSDSILWADVAHPIFMGVHATPGKTEQLEGVTFRNIDILEHHQPGPGYQGCMAINAGDSITVRNVLFDNIRVEQFTEGELLNVQVFKNGDYNNEPGRSVSDIVFRDVTYNGTGERASEIHGFDAGRQVQNVRFENLQINGRLITNPADGNISVGQHVKNIQFIAGKSAP